MTVSESRRTRHLFLQLGPGDELPGSLLRALDSAEARAGWLSATGALEGVSLATAGSPTPRRIDAPCEVVSMSGSLATHEGAGDLRLASTLAREGETGMAVLAGRVLAARVLWLDVHVVVFDDVNVQRREGRPAVADAPFVPTPTPAAAEPARPYVPAGANPGWPAAADRPAGAPPVPIRAQRRVDEVEHYPEPGDLVMHFHFGECTVIDSDGERIRLRQDKDGRVREVALSMLRIEPFTMQESTGKRLFKLSRKN
jgi:predicted DNA-binding protein with PD1-like motif